MVKHPTFYGEAYDLSAVKYFPSLLLIFMGTMDCITTVVGTLYFGTMELNPLIASLVENNLPVFVLIKLAVTVLVGVIFVLAEKTLLNSGSRHSKSFKMAHNTLRFACAGIIIFLGIVVINNVLVLLRTLAL